MSSPVRSSLISLLILAVCFLAASASASAAPGTPKAIANELRANGDLPVRRGVAPARFRGGFAAGAGAGGAKKRAAVPMAPRATQDTTDATAVSVTDHLLTATTTATAALVSGTTVGGVAVANNAVDLSAIVASVTAELATASDPAAVLASVQALSESYAASISAALTNTAISGLVASATAAAGSAAGGASTAVTNATGTSVPVAYSSTPISWGMKEAGVPGAVMGVVVGVVGYYLC